MAINPLTQYAGKISNADPTGYPYGKPQNVSAPSAGDGTPLEQAWVSDLFGWMQAILDDAGSVVPSGTPDKVGASQYLDAIKTIITNNASGAKGRLVKFLTTSGTLTINDSADDTLPAYLTSNEIKSGNYLIVAYGAGGGGAGVGNTVSHGGGGGGGGGVDRGIISLTVSTAYTIGAGGAGSTGTADTAGNGGDTTISTLTGGGGNGGITYNNASKYQGGAGGTGNLYHGQSGTNGSDSVNTGSCGTGGGPAGGQGVVGATPGEDGGLASGGGGCNFTNNTGTGGDGGDGYIEIYEWS